MKPLHPVTSMAIITLVTLLMAVLAYGASTQVLHRQVASAHSPATPSAAPSPAPSLAPLPSLKPIPSPQPASPPAAGGLPLVGIDYVDASHGWALLSGCTAGGAPCHYATASTIDGGATWSHLVQVGPTFDPADGGAPRTIRFLNPQDGFVFGGTGAFVTHDAGASWARAGFAATFVSDIAIGPGVVWAVTYPCAKGTRCAYEVRSSGDGGRTWSVAHDLPPNLSPDVAQAFPSGVIISTLAPSGIQMTLDDGIVWQAVNVPCASNPFRSEATTADGSELWEVCSAYPSPTGELGAQELFVSEDAGKSWVRRTAFPQPGLWQVITSRPHIAFAATSDQTFVSHDSGVTWVPGVAQGVSFVSIRFPNYQWGWALDSSGNLWTTPDGGDTWQEAGPIPNRLG